MHIYFKGLLLVFMHVCVNSVMCFEGSGLGMSQSSRLSSSVSAMRVLNTGSDVEEALADALVNIHLFTYPQFFSQTFTKQNLAFRHF